MTYIWKLYFPTSSLPTYGLHYPYKSHDRGNHNSNRRYYRHTDFCSAWHHSRQSEPSKRPTQFANRYSVKGWFGESVCKKLSEQAPVVNKVPDNNKILNIFFVFFTIICILPIIRIEHLNQMNKCAYWDARHFEHHLMSFQDPSSSMK